MKFPPTAPHPELDELIRKAKERGPMTADERRAQRRSWVIGEMMLEHPEMTREYVEGMMDKLEAEGRG